MVSKRMVVLSMIAALQSAFVLAQAVDHEITVAANSSLALSNDEVDAILTQMNALMAGKKYSWDQQCPTTRFIRKGNVILSDDLLISGTYEQLASNLSQVEPSANAFVVSSIDCEGVQAAGCGPIGGEPLIVGQQPGFDDELWVHERGHNVGLPHSAEYPAVDTSVAQSVGFRFMFWRLGIGHVGKTAEECNQFSTAALASIVHRTNTAGMVTPAVADGNSGQDDVDQQVAIAAKKAGLTIPAYRAVGAPWTENIPLSDIKALSASDIGSLRVSLAESPTQFWPQTIFALAIVGDISDVPRIRRALTLPMPAIAPREQIDQKTKDALRTLIKSKLAAPNALGILANRTHSSDVVENLKRISTLEESTSIIGSAAATALSKKALAGLEIANTASARAYLRKVFAVHTSGSQANIVLPQGMRISIPALTAIETKQLQAIGATIQRYGLDAYLKSGSRQ